MTALVPVEPRQRPRPLSLAVEDVTGTRGSAMAFVTTLVSGGVISMASGQLWMMALGLLPGLLALLSVILGGQGVVKLGEPQVTPISDPATYVGDKLVALVPAIPSRGPLEP